MQASQRMHTRCSIGPRELVPPEVALYLASPHGHAAMPSSMGAQAHGGAV